MSRFGQQSPVQLSTDFGGSFGGFIGSVHFADPQSMDYHDGIPKWTAKWTAKVDYLNGLLNGLPKWTTLNYLP